MPERKKKDSKHVLVKDFENVDLCVSIDPLGIGKYTTYTFKDDVYKILETSSNLRVFLGDEEIKSNGEWSDYYSFCSSWKRVYEDSALEYLNKYGDSCEIRLDVQIEKRTVILPEKSNINSHIQDYYRYYDTHGIQIGKKFDSIDINKNYETGAEYQKEYERVCRKFINYKDDKPDVYTIWKNGKFTRSYKTLLIDCLDYINNDVSQPLRTELKNTGGYKGYIKESKEMLEKEIEEVLGKETS